MNISQRYLAHVREYAALETRLNRDFTDMIEPLSRIELQRLIGAGMPSEEALDLINQTLTNEVTRFPFEMELGLG